jgi:Branched-chain amino acid transport system / permease component
MLLSLGMVLVIATGRVDLSVGAVMAIAAAVSSRLLVTEHQPAGVAIAVALVVSVLAGAWNGVLVAGFGIQPIVATLVLMVAGRGVAQLITEGQIINFLDPTMVYLGNGHLFALPFTLTLVLVMLLLAFFLVRRTAFGLFIESVGDNDEAGTPALTPGRSSFWCTRSPGFVPGWPGWSRVQKRGRKQHWPVPGVGCNPGRRGRRHFVAGRPLLSDRRSCRRTIYSDAYHNPVRQECEFRYLTRAESSRYYRRLPVSKRIVPDTTLSICSTIRKHSETVGLESAPKSLYGDAA